MNDRKTLAVTNIQNQSIVTIPEMTLDALERLPEDIKVEVDRNLDLALEEITEDTISDEALTSIADKFHTILRLTKRIADPMASTNYRSQNINFIKGYLMQNNNYSVLLNSFGMILNALTEGTDKVVNNPTF